MKQYMVVVGNNTLKNRTLVFCNSIQECQKAVADYICQNSITICDYGYDDEGDVYLLEDYIMERLGNIYYDTTYNEEEELIIAGS